MQIAVIGGGAAGFFAAIRCAEQNPACTVTLLEKGGRVLSKVRISGGGRCNVTHACFDNGRLVQSYPRGGRELRGPFERFSARDTVSWFEARGVTLKVEDDGRMFPVTDRSETIVDCLMAAADHAGVRIVLQSGVRILRPLEEGGFEITLASGAVCRFDRVLVATGGSPGRAAYEWLEALGHTIVPPVPSLFTFNLEGHPLVELAGVSVDPVRVRVEDTRLEQTGPLLITHWGLSGPAILKLSAWGARELFSRDYAFLLRVNWLPASHEDALRTAIVAVRLEHSRKQIGTYSPFGLPARLWRWLVHRAGISETVRWAELSQREQNRLIEGLTRTSLEVRGKSTFKEEFVTAGGVSLKDVDFRTLESRRCPGLFFAGEVLDLDGITGGFNFQAAWTCGHIAGTHLARVDESSDR